MFLAHNSKSVLAVAGLMVSITLLVTAAAVSSSYGQHKPSARKPPGKNGGSAALVTAGKKVYEDNKCASCHMIAGKGGKVGPDLTRTGASPKHTVAWLQTEIQNPKSHNPNSKMPAYAEKITGNDLKALATYLASLKK